MASSSSCDGSFWARQDSVASQFDLPCMASTPTAPSHPRLELYVATAAGKPLFHFAYDATHPRHPMYNPDAPARPFQSIAALSATLTAFQATTDNRVSFIAAPSSTILTHAHDALHVILIARQKPSPFAFMFALVRIAVAAILATSSASLNTHLRDRPNASPSLRAAEPLLHAALLDAITHPLPHALHRPLSLPALISPPTRHPLAQLLQRAMERHTHVTHALMFTAGPPLPSRLVACCGPANAHLSPLDILLLSAWASAPHTDDALQQKEQNQHPATMRFFPHAQMFNSGATASARVLHLRLHPDHHDAFKRAVGGQTWRPEWTQLPPHAIRLVLLANGDTSDMFGAVEILLDRANVTTHLLISMERPFLTDHFNILGTRAIVTLHDDRRLAGSINAFSYEIGIAVVEGLQRARSASQRRGNTSHNELQNGQQDAFVTSLSEWHLHVVVWRLRFIICFSDSLKECDAVRLTRDIFVPWLERWKSALVPDGERASMHPRTPLAGLFAPFDS